ncbi:uncharacterized protein LOC143921486 [Arctopsyche grandis]|uniref:uncharacterized protein LOC143921486 n=1 Tax=Arctopsyche grandis TaxID=121162 RepID=UPI00406DA4AD
MEFMEFPMQCRLCLCSAPAEAFVSIHGYPLEPLAKRISSCCQLQVEKGDGLPDTICRSCNTNLELLISFRKVCLQSEEISKIKLKESVNIKHEEVLLEDLIWENEIDVRSPGNVCNATVNDELNEWELSTSARTDSSPQIHSIENINSRICGTKTLFKCDICLKSFSHKTNLSKHKKIHTGLKPHKCKICLKMFGLKSILATHMRSHSGEKPYQCDICLKSSASKSNLALHILTHTGVKPHKCKICLKSFSQSSSLKIHQRTHTGEKPYQCDICLKWIATKNNLTKHRKIHTGLKPHKCKICLKSFSQSSSLKIHQRTHTGEKPYQCDICLKSFATADTLTNHRKIHTGLKPHKCEICLKSFGLKSSLKTHIRNRVCKLRENGITRK